MEEKDIILACEQEKSKGADQLMKDIEREANTIPKNPADEKNNLDIIKHLIKRLAEHQILLEEQSKKTNLILLFLTLVTTIATILFLFK